VPTSKQLTRRRVIFATIHCAWAILFMIEMVRAVVSDQPFVKAFATVGFLLAMWLVGVFIARLVAPPERGVK
jgi:hypothetical protein